MKPLIKTLSIVSIMSYGLLAADFQMPPSPPMLKESLPTQPKSKTSPCDEVPPMLILLPPGLQDAVDACQNEKSTPKADKLEKKLTALSPKKGKVSIISVSPTKGFVRAYTVKAKFEKNKTESTYICNDSAEECHELLK